MKLIELYIQEVTRRLPEKNRADIALELQSTIEDMLPEDHTEQDVKAVLLKLGDPVTLASGYRDRPMHLIGPRYYDVYINLLKMILPIAAVISLIALVGDNPFRDTGNTVMEAILKIIGKGISGIIFKRPVACNKRLETMDTGKLKRYSEHFKEKSGPYDRGFCKFVRPFRIRSPLFQCSKPLRRL
jgi:hypothetical protein